ncbi:MAG: ATP--guanido phosphotransferase [Oscillospiraceae bacterium]|nr:ATP--guanido phosphotransferase [Oscillospiraceae bacterium]MBQ5815865.1 ATP--guanido phosphotransferase [Oscillospiraceae bacterium]
MNKWFEKDNKTNEQGVVVSTRIRLARNLSDIPFPNRMTDEQKRDVISRTQTALEKAKFAKDITLKMLDMEKLDAVTANAMAERRIISPEFAANRKGRALFISEDESVAVFVNEEDHIRIQVLSAGSDLPVCLKIASEIDSYLDKNLKFSFDETLGYLTQCPTNLGTGLRASVMLHLPMMESNRMIENLANTVSKLGMTVRGSMGEGSNSRGALYQISNQVTLGISEQNAIDNLMSIVNQVIRQENNLRKNAYERDSVSTDDQIFRALGILSNARLVSTDELLRLTSLLRLGASLGILKIDVSVLNSLIFETGAYSICEKLGGNPQSKERDRLRAEFVREKLVK